MNKRKTIALLSFLLFFSAHLSARTIPDSAYSDIDNVGKVIRYTYSYKHPYRDDSQSYKKSALVYIPYGFDENDTKTEYNVLYLMHGGSQSPEWFFAGEYAASLTKTILDHLIYDGQIEPLVVCAVSYYTDYTKDASTN